MIHQRVPFVLAALAATTAACVDETALDDPSEVIAEVVTVDDVQVSFFAPEEGDLVVFATGPDGVEPEAWRQYIAGEMTETALYEALAFEPAPEILHAAERAAAATATVASSERDAVAMDAGAPASDEKTSSLTASWFQANKCSAPSVSWDYTKCLLDRTGNPYYRDYVFSMYGAAGSTSGTFLFDYRRKKIGGWKTKTATVKTGHWASWTGRGDMHTREMRVREGDGDHLHFSVYGND